MISALPSYSRFACESSQLSSSASNWILLSSYSLMISYNAIVLEDFLFKHFRSSNSDDCAGCFWLMFRHCYMTKSQ